MDRLEYINRRFVLNIQVSKASDIHEDKRRKLTAVFNEEFTARQIKVIEVKEDSVLGNHYHKYREMFYILKGRGVFTLVDIKTQERMVITLTTGDKLILNPEIAHRVDMKKGTITIEATEAPYISAELNDWRYQID
ncbi:hypothetical protein LCGC14_1195560 [marine sediment metagenome]|uniref:Cupin type-2 domain-containing protein n=1 Tax=marine sediment metagenome TaxID=412755 RepID=A0A0F9M5S6_9ZZZZ